MRCFKPEHLMSKKGLKVPWSEKLISALLALAIMCGIPGCSVSDENTPDVSLTEDSEYQSGFDIERVRKSIVIKGQPFEIPVALKDLKDGWTWEEDAELTPWAGKGYGVADIYYNGEKMLGVVIKNYYSGREEDGYIYNLTIREGVDSVDGFTPMVSTKQDVLNMYGEPVEIDKVSEKGIVAFDETYYYGIKNESKGVHTNGQYISASFLDNGTLYEISMTYTYSTEDD